MCWLPWEVAWDWGICESKDQLWCPLWHFRVTHGCQTPLALHLLLCSFSSAKYRCWIAPTSSLPLTEFLLTESSLFFFFNGERYHLSPLSLSDFVVLQLHSSDSFSKQSAFQTLGGWTPVSVLTWGVLSKAHLEASTPSYSRTGAHLFAACMNN